MPTFKAKSVVDDSRIISRHYEDLGLKIRWNFRFNAWEGKNRHLPISISPARKARSVNNCVGGLPLIDYRPRLCPRPVE